jgi:3-hydroxyacyl-CoA dehydrogenase
MTEIKKVAVIGSGVMGAGIAAHIANAGIPVLLLDMVIDKKNPNSLGEGALAKITAEKAAFLTHPKCAKNITIGNLDDDFAKLADMDLIIEVIIEKLELKQSLYHKLEVIRKSGSIISSNTSTLPLSHLLDGMSDGFKQNFLITHFFNPPRYMRLLELIVGPETSAESIAVITRFMDERLGKGIVNCNDRPGFIANRIGCFWLETALAESIKLGIYIIDADSIMGKPLGFPTTGAFGLMDLIGIDLMRLIAKSLLSSLEKDDDFCLNYAIHPIIEKMITEGRVGRKAGAGFYRMVECDGVKVKEVMNLLRDGYQPCESSLLPSSLFAPKNLKSLLTAEDIGGKYAWAVLSKTLNYTAKLIPEIVGNIASVDMAMKLGYNWKYGPFELIDLLGSNTECGPSWFKNQLLEYNIKPAQILSDVGNGSFYQKTNDVDYYFAPEHGYQILEHDPEKITVGSFKLSKSNIVASNESATLVDIGDGVFCFELTSKMNSLDQLNLELLMTTIELVKTKAKGLVIASDSDNFSVGANVKQLVEMIKGQAWSDIERFIKLGQDALLCLRHAPFPVVAATKGLALGGGCELLLSSSAVVAYSESIIGLVETGVGLIPSFGGCALMLRRTPQEQIVTLFHNIMKASKSSSAYFAQDMLLLKESDPVLMNPERLIATAKQLVLSMFPTYVPKGSWSINIDSNKTRSQLAEAISAANYSGHDLYIAEHLVNLFSACGTEQALLNLERAGFVDLCKTAPTLARIVHMLEKGHVARI